MTNFPFYMIRHGQTDWNREQRFQGRTDIPLNTKGTQQAADYATILLAEETDWSQWRFVSSPLIRARKTMEILRDGLGLEPDGYETDDALIEVTFGEWEKQRLVDLQKRFPDMMAEREASKWTYVPPGGESYAQACGRVRFLLDALPGPSLIVTHGGIIRAMRHEIEGLDGEIAAASRIPQDDIYRYDGTKGAWMRGSTSDAF